MTKKFSKGFRKGLKDEPLVYTANLVIGIGLLFLLCAYVLRRVLSAPNPRVPLNPPLYTPAEWSHTVGFYMVAAGLVLGAFGCYLYWYKRSPQTRAPRFIRRLSRWTPVRKVLDAPFNYLMILCGLSVVTGVALWFTSGVDFAYWLGTPSFWFMFWGIIAAIFATVLQDQYRY